MTKLQIAVLMVVAAFTSMVLTKIIASLFKRWQLTDSPDGDRKLQSESIPLGGGIAVACTLVLIVSSSAMLGIFAWSSDWITFLAGLLPAATVLVLIGLVDDFIGLTGIYKLIGQFLAATLLAVGGAQFETISLAGLQFELGDLAIPFAIFFSLGAINSFNLIDGSDAFASSVGAIVCLTMGLISLGQGNVPAMVMSFTLSGALIGFLRYNAPPAKVYLGDTGSMLIGLLVAYVSITCSVKEQAVVAIAVPIALCALPILDASAALLRRVLTGQSVFAADRGHFHHSLLLRGLSAAQAAIIASFLTTITCAGALLSYWTNQEIWAVLTVCLVFVALASFRIFGHSELRLLLHHAAKRVKGMGKRAKTSEVDDHTHHWIQIQGNRAWQELWESLCEQAPHHDVHGMKFTINIPSLHEHFFASWESVLANGKQPAWSISAPLVFHGRAIGKIEAKGRDSEGNSLLVMQDTLDFFASLDGEIARVIENEVREMSVPASDKRPELIGAS